MSFLRPDWLRRLRRRARLGSIDLGDLRRLTPIDPGFGGGRGTLIDRRYIERFIADHAHALRGDAAEFADTRYLDRFGGDRLRTRTVLSGEPVAGAVTIDLASAEGPEAAFDCVVCTQVLQYVFDLRAAVDALHRMLRPGGVVIASVPTVSRCSRYERERFGEWWRMTSAGLARLFGERFGPGNVAAVGSGNILSAIAFLAGLAAEDLRDAELDHHDPDHEVVALVRATKGA